MRKNNFDAIIKKNLMKIIGDKFGYITADGVKHDDYYKKEVFETFCDEMKYGHWKRFAEGAGSELKVHKHMGKEVPPKMASVASSSRFCYLALHNGWINGNRNVTFEEKCKIYDISYAYANLDAYFPDDNRYFEVKCHEIFDSHPVVLRNAYISKFLGKDKVFEIDEKFCKKGDGEFEIALSLFGIEGDRTMLDIKQLLCHLMGLATRKEKAVLTYLFFKPEINDKEVDGMFEKLIDEIGKVFNSNVVTTFCKKNGITLEAYIQCGKIMTDVNEKNTKMVFPTSELF